MRVSARRAYGPIGTPRKLNRSISAVDYISRVQLAPYLDRQAFAAELVEDVHSTAEIDRRETGRNDRIMLTLLQVAVFHENFVSFRRLALAHMLSWAALDQRLDELGITPVEGCLRIYRRSETDPLLKSVVR